MHVVHCIQAAIISFMCRGVAWRVSDCWLAMIQFDALHLCLVRISKTEQ